VAVMASSRRCSGVGGLSTSGTAARRFAAATPVDERRTNAPASRSRCHDSADRHSSLQDSERLDPCNETARPVRRLFRRSARGAVGPHRSMAPQRRSAVNSGIIGFLTRVIALQQNILAAHSQPLKNARRTRKRLRGVEDGGIRRHAEAGSHPKDDEDRAARIHSPRSPAAVSNECGNRQLMRR